MWAASLVLIFFSLVGCSSLPSLVPCDIINRDRAHCVPTDGGKEFNKPIKKMRGYKAFSPEDWAKLQKYIRGLQ